LISGCDGGSAASSGGSGNVRERVALLPELQRLQRVC